MPYFPMWWYLAKEWSQQNPTITGALILDYQPPEPREGKSMLSHPLLRRPKWTETGHRIHCGCQTEFSSRSCGRPFSEVCSSPESPKFSLSCCMEFHSSHGLFFFLMYLSSESSWSTCKNQVTYTRIQTYSVSVDMNELFWIVPLSW